MWREFKIFREQVVNKFLLFFLSTSAVSVRNILRTDYGPQRQKSAGQRRSHHIAGADCLYGHLSGGFFVFVTIVAIGTTALSPPIMHLAIQLSVFWVLAFLTLCAALLLLNIFYGLIGDGLELLSIGKEAVIAAIASLVEAASIWLVISFVPAAVRAMIIPALVVALIYKVAHLEDWSRYEVLLLLIFQIVIGCLGVSLFFAHFQTAIIILVAFAAVLAVIAAFARSL
jgi:hypothetical protein